MRVFVCVSVCVYSVCLCVCWGGGSKIIWLLWGQVHSLRAAVAATAEASSRALETERRKAAVLFGEVSRLGESVTSALRPAGARGGGG